MGGKLYRQGLIKMNEFVTFCGRDRIPIVWLQDSTGLDVGDAAEKAELLGLAQGLVYSIQQTDIPMILLLLRKGTASAHYRYQRASHQHQTGEARQEARP